MELDVVEIQKIIPHRWPFLLIDKILELEPGKRAVGLKNFSFNEPFFQGHFPGYPVVPGVLLVEALAQVGTVALLSLEENRGKGVFFGGIDGFRFRQPVLPGESVRLEVELLKLRGRVGKGTAKALVGERVVAQGELTFAVFDLTTTR